MTESWVGPGNEARVCVFFVLCQWKLWKLWSDDFSFCDCSMRTLFQCMWTHNLEDSMSILETWDSNGLRT